MDKQGTSKAQDGADQGRHIWPAAHEVPPQPLPGETHPGAEQILDLIQRAERHELGREFLTQGAPDAVAATFGVHAFLVDAARDHLADGSEA